MMDSADERGPRLPLSAGFRYLDSLAKWDQKSSFGLDKPRKLLAALGNPQDKIPSVHVAGTNGKGTTCALLSSMLHFSGARAGQLASPHLVSITERCIIEGAPIAEPFLDAMLIEVQKAAGRAQLEPSAFEAMIAASFLALVESRVDWMIVEVGLGGRLDATNTMAKPAATAVTSIGFDHMHYLGNTLTEIATEKAHIFRPGVPAYVGAVGGEARGAIEAVAAELRTSPQFLGDQFTVDYETGSMRSADGEFTIPVSALGYVADYQIANAALACRIAQSLGVRNEAIREGLFHTRWPGRAELFEQQNQRGEAVPVFIDGAHNPDGMKALTQYIERRFLAHPLQDLQIILSFLYSKDLAGIKTALNAFEEQQCRPRGVALRYVFTDSGNKAAVAPSELVTTFCGGDVVAEPDRALTFCIDRAGRNSLIVVSGSLYLLGRLRPRLTKEPFTTIS